MMTKLNPEVIQTGSITADKLDTAVQTSLGKADTALQSYTEQYKGTVTDVRVNGTTKSPSNGIVDLGTVITAHQTLKTINGQTIVGSGDITISGGSSDANVQAVDTGDVLDDVNVDYATTAYVDNKVANINLTAYATTAYVDGLVGDINSVLESIISGGGSGVSLITFTIGGLGGTEYQAEEGMTWEQWVNSEYNTDAFYINGEVIYCNGMWLGRYITGVTSSDIILNSVYGVEYTDLDA